MRSLTLTNPRMKQRTLSVRLVLASLVPFAAVAVTLGAAAGLIPRRSAQASYAPRQEASATSPERQGSRVTVSWKARSDGLVEWRTLFHDAAEVSTPADVFTWLVEIDTLRARAAKPLAPRAPGIPAGPERYDAARSAPWVAALGRREGARLGAIIYRDSVTGQLATGLMHRTCGERMTFFDGNTPLPDSTLDRARQVAREAVALNPDPRIDTTRTYDEREVACPARYEGRPKYAEQPMFDSLGRALALPANVSVNFVIGRAGEVYRDSVTMLDQTPEAQRARIADALASLRFSPATLGSHPVVQRRRLIIRAREPADTANLDPVRQVCVGSDTLAVRVRALVPQAGAPRPHLVDIGTKLLALARGSPSMRQFRGTVRFVAMPQASVAFVDWVTAPPDSSYNMLGLRGLHVDQRALPDNRPYGIEAVFRAGCP